MALTSAKSSSFLVLASLEVVAWRDQTTGKTIRKGCKDAVQVAVKDLAPPHSAPQRVLKLTSSSGVIETLFLDQEMQKPQMADFKCYGHQVSARDLPFCVFVRPPLRMGIDYVRDQLARTLQLQFYQESDCENLARLISTVGLPVRQVPLGRPRPHPPTVSSLDSTGCGISSQLTMSQPSPLTLQDSALTPTSYQMDAFAAQIPICESQDQTSVKRPANQAGCRLASDDHANPNKMPLSSQANAMDTPYGLTKKGLPRKTPLRPSRKPTTEPGTKDFPPVSPPSSAPHTNAPTAPPQVVSSQTGSTSLPTDAARSQEAQPVKRKRTPSPCRPQTRKSNRLASICPDPPLHLEDSRTAKTSQNLTPLVDRDGKRASSAATKGPSAQEAKQGDTATSQDRPVSATSSNTEPADPSSLPSMPEPVRPHSLFDAGRTLDLSSSLETLDSETVQEPSTSFAASDGTNRGSRDLTAAFETLMAVKMEREKAAVKARWSAMSAEERMAALEKMQQEEMMACFVRGYEMSLRQLSTAQRRERILQGLNGMWLDIGLLGGNIRISSSQVNLCPAAP